MISTQEIADIIREGREKTEHRGLLRTGLSMKKISLHRPPPLYPLLSREGNRGGLFLRSIYGRDDEISLKGLPGDADQ